MVGGIDRWTVVVWTLESVTSVAAMLLGLRFGMRLVGVRGDVPFPGAVYALTAPLAEPFYKWFSVSDRFDYPATEVASLAAAGAIIGVAVVAYIIALIGRTLLASRA